jgi:hypothetical protein
MIHTFVREGSTWASPRSADADMPARHGEIVDPVAGPTLGAFLFSAAVRVFCARCLALALPAGACLLRRNIRLGPCDSGFRTFRASTSLVRAYRLKLDSHNG